MKKPLILITHRVHPAVENRLAEFGRVLSPKETERFSAEELEKFVPDCEALMVFMPDRIDAAFLECAPRLKIIACALKGYDNIDLHACNSKKIWVTFVPDLLTPPTAELAVGLLIGLTRKILPGDRFIRSGAFYGWRPSFYGSGIFGKTTGILSFGQLGQAIATRLRSFDTEICYHDPFLKSKPFEWARPLASLKELLNTADYLILATPLGPDTVHLINRERLGLLKPGAFIINVGRGSVVDEAAIGEALTSGLLAGYAADVFELEDHSRPSAPARIPQSLLGNLDQTLLTPHLGSAVSPVRLAIEHSAADSIIDFLQDKTPPINAINSIANTPTQQEFRR